MAFLERAKSMHERGETVRAAVVLAEGLKREPDAIEALEWLLHLYVEEIPNPGMEREILQILELQPNGTELLALVVAELEEMGADEKIDALERVRERDNLLPDEPPEEHVDPTAEDEAVDTDVVGGESSTPAPEHVAAGQEGHGSSAGNARDGAVAGPATNRSDAGDWSGFDNPLAGRNTDRAEAAPSPKEQAVASGGSVATSLVFDEDAPGSSALQQVRDARNDRLKWFVAAAAAGFLFLVGLFVWTSGGEEPEVPRFVPAPEGELEPDGQIRQDPGVGQPGARPSTDSAGP